MEFLNYGVSKKWTITQQFFERRYCDKDKSHDTLPRKTDTREHTVWFHFCDEDK